VADGLKGAVPPKLEDLVPVPLNLQHEARAVAFCLGSLHSAEIGDEGRWHYLLHVVAERDPETLTWFEVGALLRLGRLHLARETRA